MTWLECGQINISNSRRVDRFTKEGNLLHTRDQVTSNTCTSVEDACVIMSE